MRIIVLLFLFLVSLQLNAQKAKNPLDSHSIQNSSYINYITIPDKVTLHYLFKNGHPIMTVPKLVKSDTSIKFAMNGSMFTSPDFMPVGLYVENRKVLSKMVIIDKPSVNFGLQPQAIFYIDTTGKAGIVKAITANIKAYKYAVELAPMLVIKGEVNPRVKGMTSRYIRNGLGITSDGKVVFLISTHSVTMEQFANKFKALGCVNAAYVDGGVSQSWQKGAPLNDPAGEFAVLVAAH